MMVMQSLSQQAAIFVFVKFNTVWFSTSVTLLMTINQQYDVLLSGYFYLKLRMIPIAW